MPLNVPKLQDVADAAGVSTATVSRCLNQPELVVEKTRLRVLKVVEDLGYAPNFNARSLASKQSQTIGAIIPTMENAIFAEGIQAFQGVLQDAGYTLLISSSSYDAKVEAAAVRTLVARGADALLLIGLDRDETLYGFLETQGVPALIAWAHSATFRIPSIGFDNHDAMRAIASHALGLGHRDVAMISAPVAENDRARARVAGVKSALVDAGLPADALKRTKDQRMGNTPAGLANSLRATGTGSMPPVWLSLASLRSPFLAIAGTLDERYVTIANAMAEQAPNGQSSIVEGAGHVVHEEKFDHIVDVVAKFLQSCDSAERYFDER